MSIGNHNKPFNDAIAHKQNIEGYPKNSGGKLPLTFCSTREIIGEIY